MTAMLHDLIETMRQALRFHHIHLSNLFRRETT